ncbi:MAG: type VI secretion system contractile sheath large subunit, partial [Desulfobacterales bacterium]|nr:type VI secretion system contractile sheath large subunit [Desulfobacterales bacterium]
MAENEKQVQSESAQAEEVQEEEKSVLDQILEEGRLARDESQKEWARDIIGEFVSQIMEGTMVVSKDTEVMINTRISQIDKLISMQLNEVMHAPEFQKLEASWRGLHYLVHQSETGEKLKIRVMNVSKK